MFVVCLFSVAVQPQLKIFEPLYFWLPIWIKGICCQIGDATSKRDKYATPKN